MRPRFYPTLVNGRYCDPVLFIDLLMERRAILFDLGDIAALPGRSVLRLTDVFVSHAHIDHFFGFDHLLRLLVGRERELRLYGPADFIDRVAARLAGYTWNLADSYEPELAFAVTEVAGGRVRRARFRLRTGFAREDEGEGVLADGLLVEEPSISVRCAELEHGTPVLGFALQEAEHVNIWRNRLEELGLDTGPWLTGLKRAIFERLPDEAPVEATRRGGGVETLPLGVLREKVVSITPGQKVAYVTDVANTAQNRKRIVDLARGADTLFIESVFSREDEALALARRHLTTGQAGTIAREAGAGRVEAFHFSPRYAGREAEMLAEVDAAFRGESGVVGRGSTPPPTL
jgi:ribonuclease Z